MLLPFKEFLFIAITLFCRIFSYKTYGFKFYNF